MTRDVARATALELLGDGVARLERAEVAGARRDAEWLLAGVLAIGRYAVYLDPERVVPADHAGAYRDLVGRRAAGEPLQHLLGYEDFHGLRIAVSGDVLIPRPETEGLVAWALEVLAGREALSIADVGTGSGAIACALAAARPDARIVAIDASPAALAVAASNVRAHALGDRVQLVEGDLLAPLGAERVDLVIANLPYIPTGAIATLPAEVADWEPRLALDGGHDGLDLVRRLITGACRVLNPAGAILLEIGEDQAALVAGSMERAGLVGVEIRRDLNGVERYAGARADGSR